ncbi:hypothetical protein KIN20_032757 [Parelaphostrongylus tenuis]|uniref:Uncharacterized protein n=1 Tax=Parelaphostrongylus tenuis TaxID=148309 RepID=A0AAD5R736_PARTN|nr:hypothetical protein KIN20_032757 [Parelaphostrongylus tenuis]
MREEPERQERLREEEKRCTEASNREKSFVIEKLPNLDMQSGTQKEEGQRYSCEEDERSALQKGGGDVMSRTEEAQCGEEANVSFIEKDENIEVLLEDCENNDKEQKLEEQQVHDNEEQRRLEEQQVDDDEKHLFLNEEKEKSPSIEEHEDILQRLNINSSAELRNRHLDNVSVNTPKANPDVASLHSSYEITPDKVYKPQLKTTTILKIFQAVTILTRRMLRGKVSMITSGKLNHRISS